MDTYEKLQWLALYEEGLEELRTINGMRGGTVPEYGRVLQKANCNVHDSRGNMYQTLRVLFNRLLNTGAA